MSRLKRAELEAGGANAKIEIQAGPNSLELIAFGLAPAIEQLDGCSSQLLEKWGYSQAFQRGVAAYPRPEKELHTYASSDDYPASAVRRGAMGEAHALVSVTDKGRASDCRIIRSSGHADLDTASCNIIVKRVRFVTARATDGTPLAAPVYLTMKWELPR
jgi:TonB family protein